MTRPQRSTEAWPPAIDEAAYHGILGDIVREIAPHTEADPVGILAVLLSGVGNALGREIRGIANVDDEHPARLNVLLVGRSRQGAKGSAQSAAEAVLKLADPLWHKPRRTSGLSTGEGLIRAVRDERKDKEPIRDKGKLIVGYQDVVVDAGVQDKRLWVVETEFARTIRVMGRDANTLSAVIRDAWDGGDLGTMVSANPLHATAPHISIVGHITPKDLHRYLQSTEIANGFANRFLWFLVKRSQLLPRGNTLAPGQLRAVADELAGTLRDARETLTAPLVRDDAAEAKWELVYPILGDVPDTMAGEIVSRGESNVFRLSVLYAALDVSPVIGLCHLNAALAVWDYSRDSVAAIFGDETGDPVMDTIITSLRERPMTTTELHNRFNRHLAADQLSDTLELLQERGIVQGVEIPTGGRPRTVWELVPDETEGDEG